MITIQYVSKREPIPGRQLGDPDQISFGVTKHDRKTDVKSAVHVSLDGTRTTRIHSHRITHSMTTGTIKDTDVDLMREFLASVSGGESFTMQLSDTDTAKRYMLIGNGSESRIGNFDWFRFSFEAQEI